jgi:hypothetical protein
MTVRTNVVAFEVGYCYLAQLVIGAARTFTTVLVPDLNRGGGSEPLTYSRVPASTQVRRRFKFSLTHPIVATGTADWMRQE